MLYKLLRSCNVKIENIQENMFLSFLVSVKADKIICGYPYSSRVSSIDWGQDDHDDWREATWTPDATWVIENNLKIETMDWERAIPYPGDTQDYVNVVLKYATTFQELCQYFSPSHDVYGNRFWFDTDGIYLMTNNNGEVVPTAKELTM